jgi:hypothetical protein
VTLLTCGYEQHAEPASLVTVQRRTSEELQARLPALAVEHL